jgi:hypothetical protein
LRVIGKPKKRALAIPEGVEDFDQILKAVFCRPNRPGAKHSAMAEVSGLHGRGTDLVGDDALVHIAPVVIPLSLVMGSVIAWVFFWVRGNPNYHEPHEANRLGVSIVVVAVCPQAVCRGIELSPQHPPRQ